MSTVQSIEAIERDARAAAAQGRDFCPFPEGDPARAVWQAEFMVACSKRATEQFGVASFEFQMGQAA